MNRTYLILILAALYAVAIIFTNLRQKADVEVMVHETEVEAAPDKPLGDEKKKLMYYDKTQGRLVINAPIAPADVVTTDCYEDLKYEFLLPIKLDGSDGGFSVADEYISVFEYKAEGDLLRLTAKERQIAEFQITAGDGQLYLKAVHPKDVYDKIVVIDPGHGGEDSGAWSMPGVVEYNGRNRIIEKDYNLAVALKLQELFAADENIKAYLTRTTDRTLELWERRALRDYLGDLFVSIHLNTSEVPSAYGLSTFFYTMDEPQDYTGKALAADIADAAAEATGMRRREIDYGDYYVLRESKVPATLVELGFMTNEGDLRRLASEGFIGKAADGVYGGVVSAFGKYVRD